MKKQPITLEEANKLCNNGISEEISKIKSNCADHNLNNHLMMRDIKDMKEYMKEYMEDDALWKKVFTEKDELWKKEMLETINNNYAKKWVEVYFARLAFLVICSVVIALISLVIIKQ